MTCKMDIFSSKSAQPMTIGAESGPFDSEEHIFELKIEGDRCLAYLDSHKTEFVRKSDRQLLPRVPQLSAIHQQIKTRCILDGEIFLPLATPEEELKKTWGECAAPYEAEVNLRKYAATPAFVAFDILYHDGKDVTGLPLMQRKRLLQATLPEDSRILSACRYIEEQGICFFKLIQRGNLNGLVAKQKDSPYLAGEQTQDWIVIRNLMAGDNDNQDRNTAKVSLNFP